MNILILASSPYSHIIPLKALAKRLNEKYIAKIYCMSLKKNKKLIESLGMIFIEYPANIKPVSTGRVDSKLIMNNVMKYWDNNQIEEGYNYYIEKDIESLFDMTDVEIEALKDIILSLNINLIFRDAVDKFGDYLGKKLNIPVIGYMTHNIYSKKFFDNDPDYYYAIFLNTLIMDRRKYLSNDFFKNYSQKCAYYYKFFEKKYNTIEIKPHHQLDPRTDLTIIFSTKFLQPKESLYKGRKYIYIYPDIESRAETVDEEIKDFVSKHDILIYISSGSITTQLTTYYIDFIKALSKGDCGIIISAGIQNDILKEYVINNNLEEKVYISKWIPQRYVLKHSSLFITSGGQNSLLESIYYETPMLVTPITSEQRMNGIIIEKLGIGYTTYNIRYEFISTGNMVNILLNDADVKDKLKIYANEYKTHVNDFRLLDKFIEENLKNEK